MKAKKHVGAWVILWFWLLGFMVLGGVMAAKHGGEFSLWFWAAIAAVFALYLIFFRKAKTRDYDKDYTREDLKPKDD